ncbi:Hypothetical predicted protein, partial [Mytilus galloprovincialis]
MTRAVKNSECDFPLSSQSTQTFSQTTTSDWEEENMAPREIFNAAMKMLSRNFPALNSQLQLPWTSLSKSSSSYYTKIITEAIQLIAQYVAPGQENNLLTDVCKKWISLKEDKPDTMTEALIASYQQQNNRLSQMQILSLFANKHTKERLMELVPGLSVFKIDAARRHATLTFPGQLINPPKVYRSRLSMPRVMHFIEFISCPTYHQAVGYGSKTLKLSSGLEITIPKVLGTQGWFSVAHILTDLLNQLSVRTTVNEVFLKSDNAGCYHCAPLLSFIQHLNSSSSIKVLQYNFSEAQSGKDICDAKTAHCKMHMIRYSGEGHDIVTPQDMRAALHANGGVKGVLASVVSVDNQQERKMVSKIPNISQMNNITFHENGVTCRRAYKIGTGSFLPPNQFKDSATLTGFTVKKHNNTKKVEEPFPILHNNKGSLTILSVRPEEQTMEEVPRNDGHETDQSISEPNNQLYPCPDMSCSKVYTKLCYLENHICLGNHVYNNKKENQFDSIKKAWASQCVAVEREHKVLVRATAPSTVLVSNNEGWALKTSKSVKRFSTKVKDYISSIHQYFNTT